MVYLLLASTLSSFVRNRNCTDLQTCSRDRIAYRRGVHILQYANTLRNIQISIPVDKSQIVRCFISDSTVKCCKVLLSFITLSCTRIIKLQTFSNYICPLYREINNSRTAERIFAKCYRRIGDR